MGYVLGVDGGNTKTDYLLHTLDGALVAHLRAGTCSHERLGMEGAHREMEARIASLLWDAEIDRADIDAAAFGLAGIDQPLQKDALTDIIHAMGFKNSIAMNDSFLGIKAGSESGTGVCSINGTGTAAGGIDGDGRWVQVGGLGSLISGDEAGGSHLAGRAIRAAYDEIYRFGPETTLTHKLLSLMGCKKPDDLHTAISTQYQYGTAVSSQDVIGVLFQAASSGDSVAGDIIAQAADALARSAAGCAVRLRFDGAIPVILIGSVWTKGRFQPMQDAFQKAFDAYTNQKSTLSILSVPPAAGSVLWALELATGRLPNATLRETVFTAVRGI